MIVKGELFYRTKMNALRLSEGRLLFKKKKKCSDELQTSNCNRLGGNYINLEGTCTQNVP